MGSKSDTMEQAIASFLADARVVFIDGGHSTIKGGLLESRYIAADERWEGEVDFPHALRQLTQAEWDEITTQYGDELPSDYLIVNGQYFVIGDTAAHDPSLVRVHGARRLTRDYYGVFVATMLFRLLKRSGNVALYASHPTDDTRYEKLMHEAVKGEWTVKHLGTTRVYNVGYTRFAREADGGLMNLLLSSSGTGKGIGELHQGRGIIIDVGGGTIDFQSFRDGKITSDVQFSVDLGIQQVESALTRGILMRYAADFKGIRTLPLDKIRKAILSNVYEGGGRRLDCKREVDQATDKILSEIKRNFDERAYGPMYYDFIVLTGGGAALLFDRLKTLLEHANVMLSISESDKMWAHRANWRGLRKLWKLLKERGMLYR